MKIDNHNDLNAVSTAGATGATGVDAGSRRTAAAGAAGSGPDTAELSGLAGKISHAVNTDAANRAAKVEQLRLQVANGTYQADPKAISRGIVNEAIANAATAGTNGK